MADVVAGAVEEGEGALHFGTGVGVEPGASHADDVEPGDAVEVCADDVRREVFGEARAALADGQRADADELMHGCCATEEDAVADGDVPGEEHVIRGDDVIANVDIVREVRAAHEEAVVAHDGIRAVARATVERAVFADAVVIADDDAAFYLGLE